MILFYALEFNHLLNVLLSGELREQFSRFVVFLELFDFLYKKNYFNYTAVGLRSLVPRTGREYIAIKWFEFTL